MSTFVIEAEVRDAAIKPKFLRAAGKIPAVYYGGGKPASGISLPYQVFRKVYEKAGESSIIELSFAGKKYPVLVHDIQFDPVSDAISHVDFIHVDMDKEVTASVKIVVVGISPAVKNMGGILDVLKHEIKIKCLPKDLIPSIEVDVSPIVDFRTSIRVKDLKLPATIKVMDQPEDTVVTATPPRAEEETKPAAVEGAVAPGAEGVAAPGATGTAPAAGAPAAAPAKEKK